jgi:hypothetical protein
MLASVEALRASLVAGITSQFERSSMPSERVSMKSRNWVGCRLRIKLLVVGV